MLDFYEDTKEQLTLDLKGIRYCLLDIRERIVRAQNEIRNCKKEEQDLIYMENRIKRQINEISKENEDRYRTLTHGRNKVKNKT